MHNCFSFGNVLSIDEFWNRQFCHTGLPSSAIARTWQHAVQSPHGFMGGATPFSSAILKEIFAISSYLRFDSIKFSASTVTIVEAGGEVKRKFYLRRPNNLPTNPGRSHEPPEHPPDDTA